MCPHYETYLRLRVVVGLRSSVAHLAVAPRVLLSLLQLRFCPVLLHEKIIYHPKHERLKGETESAGVNDIDPRADVK